jgi:hypothetical protein
MGDQQARLRAEEAEGAMPIQETSLAPTKPLKRLEGARRETLGSTAGEPVEVAAAERIRREQRVVEEQISQRERDLAEANAEENYRRDAKVDEQAADELERSIHEGRATDLLAGAENSPLGRVVVPERPPTPVTDMTRDLGGVRPYTGPKGQRGGEHDHYPLSNHGRTLVSGKNRPDDLAMQLEAEGGFGDGTSMSMWKSLAAEEAAMTKWRADVKTTREQVKQYKEGVKATRELIKADTPEVLKPVPKEPTAEPADVGMSPPMKGSARPPAKPDPAGVVPRGVKTAQEYADMPTKQAVRELNRLGNKPATREIAAQRKKEMVAIKKARGPEMDTAAGVTAAKERAARLAAEEQGGEAIGSNHATGGARASTDTESPRS